jgi:Carboxypeptidase regulatory-like domain
MKRPILLLIALAALVAAVVYFLPTDDQGEGLDPIPEDTPPVVEESGPQLAEIDPKTEALREFAASFGADTALTGEIGRQLRDDGKAFVRATDADGETVAPALFLVRAHGSQIEWIEAPSGELRLDALNSVTAVAAYAGGNWSEPTAMDHKVARHDSLDLHVSKAAAALTVQIEVQGVGPVDDAICLYAYRESRPTETFEDIFNPGPEVEEVTAWVDQSGLGRDNSLFTDAFRVSDAKDPRSQSKAGILQLNDLPAGHYLLRCSSGLGVENAEWVTLEPGSNQQQRIELVHGGFLVGRIFGPDPELPPQARVAAAVTDAAFAEFVGERQILQTLEWASVDGRRVAEPDAAGNYRLGPIAPGKFLVMGQAEGLLPARAGEAVVTAGQETRLADLHLLSGHAIAILVRDAVTGEVLTDAQVYWRITGVGLLAGLATWRGTEEVDDAGRHILRNLPFQLIEIEARSEGFAALRQEYLMPKENWIPSPELALMEFPLEVGRSIRGQVFGPQGQVIANAQIRVGLAEDEGSISGIFGMLSGDGPSTNSDQDGRFALDFLPRGNYIVYAQDEQHAPGQSEEVDLNELEFAEVTVQLAPAGSLLVRYLDEDGQPGTGMMVVVTHLEKLIPAQQSTDENGEASFSRLAAGNYNVQTIDGSASPEGIASGNFEIGLTYFELLAGEDKVLEIGPGLATASLIGIMSADGAAAPGISVTLIGGGVIKAARTEEDGSYSFDGLLPQTYTALIGTGLASSHATEILIEPGENRFDHVLPGGGLEVHVVRESDGSPATGTPVTATSDDSLGNPIMSVTDSEGIALFRFLQPGPYKVSAGSAAMPMLGGDPTLGAQILNAQVGSQREKIELRLAEAATFRVRALDLDGNPLSGVSMFYLNDDGQPLSALSMQATNSKGVVELGGLPAGPGRILLKHPSAGQKEISINLSSGELSKQEVRLDPGVVVWLKVIDASGGPAAGVFATLKNDRGVRISMLYSMQDAQAVNQSFFAGLEQRLGPVAPGRYTVEIFRLGGKIVREELVIPANSPEIRRTLVYKP